MRIIGLMVLRNESWIIGASLRAALKWVDGVAILLDRCTDRTVDIIREIARETGADILVSETDPSEHWAEMTHRQKNLEDARTMGGTHYAIIDADEILTHNNLEHVRGWFEALKDGEVLDVPMIAPWKSLDVYSPHTRGIITLGFKDMPGMGWAPRGEEQYHHHNRPPHGMTARRTVECEGGVFHLQWAAWERMKFKHIHYMMSETVRWSYSAQEINDKYHWFDKPPHGEDLKAVPAEWWGLYCKSLIKLNAPVWYERECRRMAKAYGESVFSQLDLFGWRVNVPLSY